MAKHRNQISIKSASISRELSGLPMRVVETIYLCQLRGASWLDTRRLAITFLPSQGQSSSWTATTSGPFESSDCNQKRLPGAHRFFAEAC